MVLLSRIYTKTGDKGRTSLGDGKRVPKSSLRIDVIGSVDEGNAAIGLCRLYSSTHTILDKALLRSQNDLFDVGADLCLPSGEGLRIVESQVLFLEHTIDQLNAHLKPLKSFVLPGGSSLSAHLHMARTITRRSERLACKLLEEDSTLNPFIISYLNRLSDLLFVMCRIANDNGQSDILWVPGENR